MGLSKKNKIVLILFTVVFQIDRVWDQLSILRPWRDTITPESIANNMISGLRLMMFINMYCVFLAIGFYRDFSWNFEIIRYRKIKDYIFDVYKQWLFLAVVFGLNVVLAQVLTIKGLAIGFDLTNLNQGFWSFIDISRMVFEPIYLTIDYKLLLFSFFIIVAFVMSFFLKYTFLSTILKKNIVALAITFIANITISIIIGSSWKMVDAVRTKSDNIGNPFDIAVYSWVIIEIIIFGWLSYKALSNVERRVL